MPVVARRHASVGFLFYMNRGSISLWKLEKRLSSAKILKQISGNWPRNNFGAGQLIFKRLVMKIYQRRFQRLPRDCNSPIPAIVEIPSTISVAIRDASLVPLLQSSNIKRR